VEVGQACFVADQEGFEGDIIPQGTAESVTDQQGKG
jgi:hypothetical protein